MKKHRRRHRPHDPIWAWPAGGPYCGYCSGSGSDPQCPAVHDGPSCPCPVCTGTGTSVGATTTATAGPEAAAGMTGSATGAAGSST